MSDQPATLADGPLLVTAKRYGTEVAVVSLAGELDRSNVDTAREVVFAAIAEGEEILVIDLSALEFLDSSGIELLVAAGRRCGRDGLRIVPSRSLSVTRIIRLTGVASLITFVADRPMAAA